MRTDLALFQGCLAFLLHFLIPFPLPDDLLTISSPWKRDEWNTSNCLFNSGTWMSNRRLKLNHTWFLHKIPSWWSLLEPIFSLSCSNSLSISHPWQPLCARAHTHAHTHSVSLTLHLTPSQTMPQLPPPQSQPPSPPFTQNPQSLSPLRSWSERMSVPHEVTSNPLKINLLTSLTCS